MTKCVFLAVVATVSLSGCGTLWNVSGGCCGQDSPKVIYGGVLLDAATMHEYADKMDRSANAGDATFTGVCMALVATDMAVCAALDTATLPLTVSATLLGAIRESHHNSADTSGAKSDPPSSK
jgi:hypothetical protein